MGQQDKLLKEAKVRLGWIIRIRQVLNTICDIDNQFGHPSCYAALVRGMLPLSSLILFFIFRLFSLVSSQRAIATPALKETHLALAGFFSVSDPEAISVMALGHGAWLACSGQFSWLVSTESVNSSAFDRFSLCSALRCVSSILMRQSFHDNAPFC